MRRAIVILVTALVLAGCGGGGEDQTKGCDEGEAWLKALTTIQDIDRSSLESMQETLGSIEDTEAAMIKTAPEDVSKALVTIRDADDESFKAADQEAKADAEKVRNDWLTEDCGLAIPD